ncbi:hypothetical protein KM1_022680 [Entamoeba histolytica HM-3:IMSS]|uniref:Uncharacterized protein n=6 Tax=Entamoeba TaxID=5758 RepID=C4M3I2_ENTH1|nr:hypothetical protein ENU1_079080 [Entamoeba nuttalli P19]XP_655122.1 hypothetical protein EHI_138400 [Entamoeba histolytica HM-1:IMSS]EMD48472.1 Hypothetical protein EHI5A_185820 [Entamoeba histolytica KU27]EMS16455.1 hypothetical protein KM1_022680 [Entamoeba histolytica HM-3:IMSS]ENY61152.1 hypothetical protein EHI7A_147550 [Entamoeba histolytica HM-1:IMSS-A]EAL49735.1 hypothetical protein EHI_138400 [Entamoeba histolytica HM-1:IMSS]EKE40805.1 hypothetical protein ENU1_079080 [Entamoeba |eukprot:XP_008856874.1 hypothetical protein ENU1_079080 [Entamoeba nuttalli P19]
MSMQCRHQPKEYYLIYREKFIDLYCKNKYEILQTILTFLREVTSDQIKEVLKIIFFDDDCYRNEILLGDFTLDLRRLHVETVLTLWVFLQESKKNPSVTAETIRMELQM